MRRMRICFTDVFFVFFAFCSLLFLFATKIPDNRSRERLNGFSWNFYQTIAGKMEFASPYPYGARPLIIFWGAKNYTLCTWLWRLASDWELVCWLWHCAATAVALKMYERVNAFNLVLHLLLILLRERIYSSWWCVDFIRIFYSWLTHFVNTLLWWWWGTTRHITGLTGTDFHFPIDFAGHRYSSAAATTQPVITGLFLLWCMSEM